jgi:hypothetical protein
MIEIHTLSQLTAADLMRVASGYTSSEKYMVHYTHSDSHITFELQRVTLDEPCVKQYDHYDEETLQHYNDVLAEGYSFGAYAGDLLIGLIAYWPDPCFSPLLESQHLGLGIPCRRNPSSPRRR